MEKVYCFCLKFVREDFFLLASQLTQAVQRSFVDTGPDALVSVPSDLTLYWPGLLGTTD